MRRVLAPHWRFALGAVLALVVLAAAILLLTIPGDENPPRAARPRVTLPELNLSFANRAIGVSGRIPNDWSAIRGPGFVHLRSRKGGAVIAIAAPRTRATPSTLLADALAQTRRAYRKPTVKKGAGKRLGGLPAKSLVVYARNRHNVPIRILLAAARGRRLGYVLEAFTRQRASVRELVTAQQILVTLRLAG